MEHGFLETLFLDSFRGWGSGTSSPLSFSAYWAIFGPDPQGADQAPDQSCPLAPRWPHWSPPSSVSQNASADVPVVLGAEEMHPSVGKEVGLTWMEKKNSPPL
jgi:hypothetical protein